MHGAPIIGAKLSAGAALALVLVGCSAAVGGRGSSTIREHGSRPVRVDFDKRGWTTDFARHSVPLTQFHSGGPPRDGIPPIDHPRATTESSANRYLNPREPVFAVVVNGHARAYPLRILVWHEIVNDTLGGTPVAVTYCPLCNSALVFDRRAAGRTLSFGTTGNLRNSDLVMWDRQTQSWWQQLTGNAVVGKLTGTQLRTLASQILSWSQFTRAYPRGDVLSRDTGFDRPYGENPYVGYDQPQTPPFLLNGRADPRLPPKERVAAVFAGEDTAVVPFAVLVRRPATELSVGGVPAVVFYAPHVLSPLDERQIANSHEAGTAGAFDRRLANRTLDFAPRGNGFVDRQTGSTWDITGHATAGPLAGRRLRQLRHDEQFWFALAAFLPKARLVR